MKKIIGLLLYAITLNASQFMIMTEDLKPYNYLEGDNLKGISVEVIQSLLENLGYTDEKTLIYPWSRAVKILNTNPKAVLFSMSYTKERAKRYKFACPLSTVEVYIFTKKDNSVQIKDIQDLKKLKLGVIQDFGAHKYLVEKGFNEFDYSSSTKIMVQKLSDNKIDAFPSAPFAIQSLDIDSMQIQQTNFKLYETQLCIAFNQAISDEEVKKWQDELQKIHQSGQYREIYNKYIRNIKP